MNFNLLSSHINVVSFVRPTCDGHHHVIEEYDLWVYIYKYIYIYISFGRPTCETHHHVIEEYGLWVYIYIYIYIKIILKLQSIIKQNKVMAHNIFMIKPWW